jgi:hypothetical protein
MRERDAADRIEQPGRLVIEPLSLRAAHGRFLPLLLLERAGGEVDLRGDTVKYLGGGAWPGQRRIVRAN